MTGLPFEQPERVRSVLERWETFPLDRRPRPFVFLDGVVHGLGFVDGERKQAFNAGAIASVVPLPDGLLNLIGRDRTQTASPLLITECQPVVEPFRTDRGMQQLPAYRLVIEGTLNPCAVLDPNVELWWPEPGHLDDLVPAPPAWIEPDGHTLHLHVGGSTSVAGVQFTERHAYVQTTILRTPRPPAVRAQRDPGAITGRHGVIFALRAPGWNGP